MKNFTSQKLNTLFGKYDQNWVKNYDSQQILEVAERSTRSDALLPLISFTCSTINSAYMFDRNKYDSYVSLSTIGNNLEDNIRFFKSFIPAITKVGIKPKLLILIGNTDPYYIYSQQLALLPGINEQQYFSKMTKRWSAYKVNLENWLKKQMPKIPFVLISWFELEQQYKRELGFDFKAMFEKVLPNIGTLFEDRFFNQEAIRLKQAFGPGKYFADLEPPSEGVLNEWVRRKFTEYALQGLWIKLIWQNGILLQNEKPALLRYEMYQPLVRKYLNSTLPNIFPFGIEDGYS